MAVAYRIGSRFFLTDRIMMMGQKSIRRALTLVLLLCLFGVLAGCGNQAKKETIVYMTHNDKAVFGSFIKEEFDKIAKQNNYPVQYLDAGGNADKQIAQFEEAVKNGAKQIVLLAVDETKIVPAVEKAVAAGVNVVFIPTNTVQGRCRPSTWNGTCQQAQASFTCREIPRS